MGPDGMRVLVAQFTNVPPAARMQIAMAIIAPASIYRGENVSKTNQIPDEIMVDGLIRVVQDYGSFFRTPAIQRLSMFGPLASNAVPALLPILHGPNSMDRQSAILALGEIKAQPDLVIPALTNFLNDHDPITRTSAEIALRALGYNAHLGDDFERHRRPFVPWTNQPAGPR
jgi:hypothetical protein